MRKVRVSRLGRSEHVEDKKLTTAHFTDIVGPTEKLIQMGDRAWRNALDQHDAVASALVKQFRGDLTGGSDMAFASRDDVLGKIARLHQSVYYVDT